MARWLGIERRTHIPFPTNSRKPNHMSNRMALAILALLSLSLAACNGDEAETAQTQAPDERPPLVSVEPRTLGFNDFSAGTEKSFGIFVCITDEEVALESVQAMSSEGEIEVLGGFLYEAEDGFVGAVDGFPPKGLDESFLSEIPGATVVTHCDAETRSQVVLGANRTGPGGGLIEGVRVNYDGGSLDVPDYSIILCGDNQEFCEDVGSGT